MADPGIPVSAGNVIDLAAARSDAGQMGRRRQRCFIEDTLDRRMRALAG